MRGLEFANHRVSRFGERHRLDWLTYNPLQLHAYHRMATADAPAVIDAVLQVFPDVQRLVDVGAGSGAFAAEALRRGRSVEACEYTRAGRLYARCQKVSSRSFDLQRDPPAKLVGPFDLAYCFEVAEHCAPMLGERLVSFLSQLAPLIVFTAAQPGQGGLGHVNEQQREYWIERFAHHDRRYDLPLTERLREAFARRSLRAPWFAENVIVLVV